MGFVGYAEDAFEQVFCSLGRPWSWRHGQKRQRAAAVQGCHRQFGVFGWMVSNNDWIRDIPIFAGLSDGGLAELSAAMQLRSYPARALIVGEDEPGHELFLIRSGRVEVVRHVGMPDETRLAVLEERDFFGEMSLIEARVHSASVRALEPCELLVLKSGDLYRLFQHQMDQYAIVILNIARDLCRRLRALDEVYTGKGVTG